jgi:mRNA interferase RelE/StbE
LAWTVNFETRAFTELKKLDSTARKQIVRFLQTHISGEINPRARGKALQGDKAGLRRYRVGSFRVICRIEDAAGTVLVLRIAHRKEVYR